MAIEQVGGFNADMGGTEIAKPIEHIISMHSSGMKRVFCLTDGAVGNPQ